MYQYQYDNADKNGCFCAAEIIRPSILYRLNPILQITIIFRYKMPKTAQITQVQVAVIVARQVLDSIFLARDQKYLRSTAPYTPVIIRVFVVYKNGP